MYIDYTRAADLKLLNLFIDKLKNDAACKHFRYFNTRTTSVIKNHIITILIKDNDNPIGYGHIDFFNNRYWLGICVLSTHQAKGYGHKIMDNLLEVASHNKISTLTLTVDVNNIVALNMYSCYGFQVTEISDINLTMSKNITLSPYKVCYISSHISTGDNFTMYAAIKHFSEMYDTVVIYCLYRNIKFLTQLYTGTNVKLNLLPRQYLSGIAPVFTVSQADIIKVGATNPNWKNSDEPFWRYFYTQMHIPYSLRYKYMNINRDYEREILLYNKIISRYGEQYIFVMDHRNVTYRHIDPRANVEISKDYYPIFHPNINYYESLPNHQYYPLWDLSLSSDNILDYGIVMEKACEIHINDSAFSCYCPYLDLSSVSVKSITTKIDYSDYHNSFINGWLIIEP